METLGYTEMAIAYENTVGPMELRPLSFSRKINFRRVTTAAAIIGFIFFGGFTTVVASTLSRNVAPTPQEANF